MTIFILLIQSLLFPCYLSFSFIFLLITTFHHLYSFCLVICHIFWSCFMDSILFIVPLSIKNTHILEFLGRSAIFKSPISCGFICLSLWALGFFLCITTLFSGSTFHMSFPFSTLIHPLNIFIVVSPQLFPRDQLIHRQYCLWIPSRGLHNNLNSADMH